MMDKAGRTKRALRLTGKFGTIEFAVNIPPGDRGDRNHKRERVTRYTLRSRLARGIMN